MTEDNPICDRCGQPLLPDVRERGRYTLADQFDDDGRWVAGRHADCHKSRAEEFENAKEGLDATIKKAQGLLKELRRKL